MSLQDPNSCGNNISSDHTERLFKDLEVEAAVSFINKIASNFLNTSIRFHVCRLSDAINEACMVELDRRKILCLYLHNSHDKFSATFCENLKNMEVAEILNRSFFLLGWDVEESRYQSALVNALNKCNDLSILIDMLTSKISAVLCVVPIKDSVTIFSCMKGRVSDKDFLVALVNAEKFLIAENEEERKLEDLTRKTRNENDMDSSNYQKLMANMLGDRDYDSFEHDQHEYLKKKIAFAMLGPPQKEEGYEKQDIKKIQSLYANILKNSNIFSKYKDRVEVSFIFNCTEPLPSEKLSRAKKYKEEYNPNTDVMPLPIFVIRKCRGSPNPCRIFVDNTGRIYNTWQDYISRNKLHKCQMILPQNGRYNIDESGEVILEKYMSPACGIDSKVLQGADYLNAAGGLISGGIFVAAAIPTVAVAPAAVIAGGIIGLGVGIYSLGRGAYTLYDRKKHKETLNFVNSEARGAYLNIVASSLGFVGAGATVVVSQLASMGVNIGQGASAALRTIGIARMSANSLSILNAGCDIIDHWRSETKASLLTIIQLKSSILFFGNVVYIFEMKKVDMAVDIKHLQDRQELLMTNRQRKTVYQLLKRISLKITQKKYDGRIEIVSPIYEVKEQSAAHDVLIESNDKLPLTEVKFVKKGDELMLNDTTIDTTKFSYVKKKDFSILSSCQETKPDPDGLDTIYKMASDLLKDFNIPKLEILVDYLLELLRLYENDVRLQIIKILSSLLANISNSIDQTLLHIFDDLKYLNLVNMIVEFYLQKTKSLESQFNLWINTQEEEYFHILFDDIDKDGAKRMVIFFKYSVDCCYDDKQLTKAALKDLLDYFYHWLAEQIYIYQIKTKVKTDRNEHSDTKVNKFPCNICGGYYYKNA